jgi:hypothetical protein
MRTNLVLLFAAALATTACSEAASTKATLTGAWERYLPNREAPIAYEVLEFFDNGALILHNAQGGVAGQYSVDAEALTVGGALGMFWRGPIDYTIDRDVLTLDIASLGAMSRSEWARVQRDAFFGIEQVDGDVVPSKLPELLAAAMAGAARDWRDDAIPVALKASRLPSGDFAVTLTFVSPRDRSGLQVIVGRWGFVPSVLPSGAWGDHPLPIEFADAPELRRQLATRGNSEPLLAADLRVWSKGPIWTVTTLGAAGSRTRSDLTATTGEPIVAEAPPRKTMNEAEYIASYNAQWNAIVEGLERRFASRGGNNGVWDSGSTWDSSGSSSDSGSSSSGASSCAYASHAACNAAAAGDLWAADRIEYGRADRAETDWYD